MAMHKVFKNLLYVATAEVGTKMIGFFTAYLVPKILEPSDYGLWVSLSLIVTYAGIAHFGTLTAIIKEGPYYLGRGDHKKLAEMESTALGSLIFSSLLVLIGGIVLELTLPGDGSGGDSSLIWMMVFAASFAVIAL
jgi:O-antigen/teichoic acid export membrane protein